MPNPQPPAHRTATWSMSIANMDLTNVAFLSPHPDVVRYTRRESDYCEMAVAITDRDDLNALYSAAYRRVLRAWRNGNNIFNGQFTEVRETADAWEFVAKDPYYNMHWREVRANVNLADDAGQIAWDLIALQNGYSDSRIRQGSVDSSVNRSRSYLKGERVAEKIDYLTRLTDGFYFTIDAVDNPPNEWADFVVHYPKGEQLADVRFEFGAGTLENCYDYLRESLPLVNRANMTGLDPGLVASAESSTSPDLHGLWEESKGQVLTNDLSVLGDIAAGQISDTPLYRVTMMAGPEAPQLFTDFDVGQSPQILIRRLGKNYVGFRRVTEATVVLDVASGAEELESIEFLDPEEEE